MATEKFANAAADTLNGGITNVATSLVVHSATPFPLTPQFRVIIGTEIMLVTGVAGTTFTVTRGIENTTPAVHADNAAVTLVETAGSITRNPRSMSVTGDIEYLDAGGAPASLAAPADGIYDVSFASGIPSYTPVGAATELTGVIKIYGGAAAPSGFLICDGAAKSRATFAALFAVIGTAFGAGDGATTFNVPDFRQRFPLGKATSGTGSVLGSSGGQIDHAHTSAAHSHAQQHGTQFRFGVNSDNTIVATINSGISWLFSLGSGGGGTPAGAEAAVTAVPTASVTPGNTGINNPPYQSVNFIIKT